MEVTRTNFENVLTELDDILNDATFLAIDGEFTGLNSGPDANAFDTPAQYYAKLRTGSMDFLLVQFGLSVFTYNSENDIYSQRSYNFYVFPRPFNRSSPDCRFMCQASSIAFLANQGFDFNKLFKHGIPYLTKAEEEKLSKKIEEKQKARDEGFDLIPIPDDDKQHIEEICSKIEEFIDSENEEHTVERCNAFIRRLIYQEVKLRWPNKVRLETKNENGNQFIIVNKVGTKEEEEQKEMERREKEKLEVQQAVGLSAVLRKIADSGKLIVGHNMLLDLCHIIHQFFGPLPESYTEFKSLVHCLFPKLLDTKIICQSAQFKDLVPSILNHLLETLHFSPFSIPQTEDIEARSYTLLNDKLHEAGYDAYVTGLCFIALSNRLGSLQKPEVSTVLADSPLLNPYLNKLLIARLKDYPHISLTGKDPNPSRDHVFHITFPKQWKLSDLSQLFTPYGGAYVSWLSDTTAYAALYRRDQAKAVVKNLFKSTQYSLQKYGEHQANLVNEKPAKPERKRKISESDSPSKESTTPAPTTMTTTTTDGSNAAAPNPEEDGWEVASGNDCSKFTPRDDDDDVGALAGERPSDQPSNLEEFSVVRKVRLKNAAAARSSVGPDLRIAATTRYTILSDLDDEVDKERIAELRKRTSPDKWLSLAKDSLSTAKRSPKKVLTLSPVKRKQRDELASTTTMTARRRNLTSGGEEQKMGSPKRPGRTTPSARSSKLTSWCTWLRLIQLVGVLVVLYFFTIL